MLLEKKKEILKISLFFFILKLNEKCLFTKERRELKWYKRNSNSIYFVFIKQEYSLFVSSVFLYLLKRNYSKRNMSIS